jgi:ketosteroid isomerase-like protein
MAGDIAGDILAAEARRCDAMRANDPERLDAILDERLHFSHATGVVDDKPTFLAKMASGRIEYTGIAWSEEKVTALGPDAALLTGRMDTDVNVEGELKALKNRVITVWSKQAGDWRLLAFQSTPLKG